MKIKAIVIDEISGFMPTQALPKKCLKQFQHLALADPYFNVPDRIDILLGVDSFCRLLPENSVGFTKSTLSGLETHFGWVIMGKTGNSQPQNAHHSFFTKEPTVQEMFSAVWENEDQTDSKSNAKNDEISQCEMFYQETTRRLPDGSYSISFPFSENAPELGSNRKQAFKSYINLEKKLQKTPRLHEKYHEFMEEFIDLGHMTVASKPQDYILPQLVVVREDKSSTKVRTVFHGSHPDNTGMSLNDRMLKGTTLQPELVTIMQNFRFPKVTLISDIGMAYRKIHVNEGDRKFQHIFYRRSGDEPVLEYEVSRMLYGLKPSAYLLQRVLQDVADEAKINRPMAHEALTYSTYMDDCICGAEDISQAKQLRHELETSLEAAGFSLKKYGSSEPEVLADLPPEKLEKTLQLNEDTETIKVLGLHYDTKSDSFMFTCQQFHGDVTMRTVLSYTAKMYDPLDFLAPLKLFCKHFIQKCHMTSPKLGWDDSLPASLEKEWLKFAEDL